MMLTAEDAGGWLARLEPRERAIALARIAFRLTVAAREFEASAQRPEADFGALFSRAIGLLEVLHPLTDQLRDVASGGGTGAFTPEGLAASLFEKARFYGVLSPLRDAFRFAMTRAERPSMD